VWQLAVGFSVCQYVSHVCRQQYTLISIIAAPPGRRSEYFDERVCVFVCQSACIPPELRHIFTSIFPYYLWPWLGPSLAALRLLMVIYPTSSFMADVELAHNDQKFATRKKLKVTQQEPTWICHRGLYLH